MTKEDIVRIGFVGVGNMGQCAHLKNYAIIPECQVVALAEIRPQLAKWVAAKYNVPKVYSSHEEMLKKEKLDGIVASQPFTRHGTLVPELLKAAIPVFIEKPLAGSIQMGEKILKALEASGTWLMVGYHKRSDPAVMYAKDAIEQLKKSGEIGKVRYIRITMPAGDWIAEGFSDLVRTDEKLPSVEWDPAPRDMSKENYELYLSFVNYYIHQINLLRYFLGEPYRVSYADRTGTVLAAESNSGIPSVIEMNPYSTTVAWNEEVFVAFEKGFVKISLTAPLAANRSGSVEIFKDPGNNKTPVTIRPDLPWIHAMRQQAINFIKAIKGERKPPCEAHEAMEDLIVAREYIRIWKNV